MTRSAALLPMLSVVPDQWELGHGFDPQAFDAWRDADGNGWANLEDYLNERAAGRVATTQ